MFTVAVGDHIGQLIGTGIGESGSCPLYKPPDPSVTHNPQFSGSLHIFA